MGEERFMQLALQLAKKGEGRVSPNPLVGCVIVKRRKIVGRGWHKKFGSAHAEINALKQAGSRAIGSTMYVNLEPCYHYGKTGPCTRAIIEAKVGKAVIAMLDPNPLVKGKGVRELKKAGIKVKVGLMEREAKRRNEFYITYMKTGKPFVLMKVGMSLDGKISYGNERGKRITGKESFKITRQLRSRVDAVLVGINTVIKDNPRLTARVKGGRNPVRVIVDSKARIPLGARVLKEKGKVIVACTKKAPKGKLQKLTKIGAGVIVVREKSGLVDLGNLVKQLGVAGISSLMIEGGAKIFASALRERMVDRTLFFISPKIIGKGLDVFGWEEIMQKIKIEKVGRCGEDLLIECMPS